MRRDPKTNQTVKLQRYATNDLASANKGVRAVLERSKLASIILKVLAVFGVSLIMADGVLTPAQSVLGAVQGQRIITAKSVTITPVSLTLC